MKLISKLLLVILFCPPVHYFCEANDRDLVTPHRRHGQIKKSIQITKSLPISSAAKPVNVDVEDTNFSEDAIRVNKDEFDQFFITKYGLLFQKHSNEPFDGRIIKITTTPEGKYVDSDENWSKGRKNGLSIKWFSNGVKMYERNYKDGRWHGPVTRWWPNGQRMYVTAYTDGVKSEDEAKWKSDGTQFKAVVSSGSNLNKDKPSSTNPTALDEEIDNTAFPTVDLNLVTEDTVITPSDPIVVPDTEGANELDSVSIDADALLPVPSVSNQATEVTLQPEKNVLSEPSISNPKEQINIPALPDNPSVSVQEESITPPVEVDIVLPDLSNDTDTESMPSELPPLPGLPAQSGNNADPLAPPLVPDSENETILPASDDDMPTALPPLPGLEGEANIDSGNDLPPLPPLP